MGRWFGRDKEEDPLAGLRGDGDSSISSMGVSDRTGSSGAESSGLSSSSGPREPRKRSGVGAAVVFAIVVLITYGAMIVYLEGQPKDSEDSTNSTSSTTPVTTSAPTTTSSEPTVPEEPTSGKVDPPSQPTSLLGQTGINRVFTAIKKNLSSTDRVSWLRIQADRANVTVSSKNGTRTLTIGPDLEVGSVDAGAAGNDTVSMNALSASGLNRAIATVTKRSGSSRGEIDYVLLFGSPASWSIFLKNQSHTLWRSSLDGRDVSQPGGGQQ